MISNMKCSSCSSFYEEHTPRILVGLRTCIKCGKKTAYRVGIGNKIYTLNCTICNHIFDLKLLSGNTEYNCDCPKCGEKAIIPFQATAQFFIPQKHRAIKKGYDSHPLDNGVPFGELPGDSDYKDIHSPFSPKP